MEPRTFVGSAGVVAEVGVGRNSCLCRLSGPSINLPLESAEANTDFIPEGCRFLPFLPDIYAMVESAGTYSSARAQGGLTLPRNARGTVTLLELLVAAPLSLLVFGAVVGLYHVSVGQQTRTANRVNSLIQQQNGIERMERELRQAVSVTPVSSQIIEAVAWVRPAGGGSAAKRRVRYDCSQGACQRLEGPVGGDLTSSSNVVVSDVLNADVFDLEPDFVNPTYVRLGLEVRVEGARNPITLRGGFALPNLTSEG